MRGHLQQGRRQLVVGWLLAAFATVVYLLTMSRTVDWWDCGEFITTSYLLQVGHPPGAPLYQLLARCMMMLSFGNPLWVAPLSNALSALCGGLTVMVLFRTLCELTHNSTRKNINSLGPVVGALCYLFCDTVWFSAVESEVYAMAMLFCSLDVWIMLRWCRRGNPRRLLLLAFLLGLGVCVHLMTLLVLPALLWIFFRKKKGSLLNSQFSNLKFQFLFLFFFYLLIGLSPYAIVPIRAAANPPINLMGDDFGAYLRRDRYAHAPLYPRLWREDDAENWKQWEVSNPDSFWDNAKYYVTYQLGYMYLRYLVNNFFGRRNMAYDPDCGAAAIPNPPSHFPRLPYAIFILPFLLGLWGLVAMWRRRRSDVVFVMLLFLFGGIVLNVYLNHPCYEPRERDYAYVLSFYAFALWIGVGAADLMDRRPRRWMAALLLLAPATLAFGNWGDHNRSSCHSVHDIAMAHLQSCDPNAMLITYGDNDTYPLWYLQQVEGLRTDIEIHNINLEGYYKVLQAAAENVPHRPIYLTHYAYLSVGSYLGDFFRCEGFCWRILPSPIGADDTEPLRRHLQDSIRWHITPGEYLPPVSRQFLDIWHENTTVNIFSCHE